MSLIMRNEIVVTVLPVKGILCVHFCEPKKLQGDDYNLCFPLHKTENVDRLNFNEIENIMIVNNVAKNVTLIEKLRNSGLSADYRIVYNYVSKE